MNRKLDPNKLSPFKMLLFDMIPTRWARSLANWKKCKCLHRSDEYRNFEAGLKQYKAEINIVRLLRDFRYIKASVDKLLSEKPQKLRDELKRMRSKNIELLRSITQANEDMTVSISSIGN